MSVSKYERHHVDVEVSGWREGDVPLETHKVRALLVQFQPQGFRNRRYFVHVDPGFPRLFNVSVNGPQDGAGEGTLGKQQKEKRSLLTENLRRKGKRY